MTGMSMPELPGWSRNVHSSIKLPVQDIVVVCLERQDPMFLTQAVNMILDGSVEHSHERGCIIIRCDPVNGKGSTVHTLMDEHKLTARLATVFVPARFQGQPDGPHLPLAGGQTIAGRVQVKVAGP